jgi:hypothetical protein
MLIEFGDIRGIRKHVEAFFIKMKDASQEFLLRTEQDHPNVDELFAFNVRDHSDHCVFK